MARHPASLSLAEARRLALAAQGLDRPRPSRPPGARELAATLRRLGVLQLDFVNVLVPAHYVVPFSRHGPYDRALLDDVVYRRRQFTEQWAHEAAIIPVSTWPLLRHRMAAFRVRPWPFGPMMKKIPEYVDRVLREVRERGPLTADELPGPDRGPHRIPGAWIPSVPRATLEAHFARGVLAVADRRPNFARSYDLAERVIPAEQYRRDVAREDAERELVRLAARAQGVATVGDLADYYRMPARDARARAEELAAAGELERARVEGWKEVAYRDPHAAPAPGAILGAALLSPFDPLIWFRPRTERLFGFHYRLEIYVPAAKRRWGYYVLPFLLDGRLVARVDLKADRAERRLLVLSAHLERGADPDEVAVALARELGTMAEWLSLDGGAAVAGRRGFAGRLAAALR